MRIEDLIEKEDVVITVSHLGYIKRTSTAEYRAQRRGGRGAMAGRTRDEDYIEHLFIASTHHTLMFFTEKGRCFWLKVYEIPEADKTGKGRAIQNMIQIPPDDKIRTVIDVPQLDNEEFLNKHCIVLCTKKGIIKKTRLEDFSRPRANGVNAITIEEGDQLLDVSLAVNDESYIMMAIKSGRAVCFTDDKVRATGRGAIGVFGIELDDQNDEVVGMICVPRKDQDKQVLVVSEKGLGKRTSFMEKNEETGEMEPVYRITNRGGKGVKTINVTEKTGGLAGLLLVDESEDLMITCESGVTIRMKVTSIREAGRATQGVKLINIDEGDKIAAIAAIRDQEEDEAETEGEASADDQVTENTGSEETPASEETNNETEEQ
jgi:DNA gyrase subunit A